MSLDPEEALLFQLVRLFIAQAVPAVGVALAEQDRIDVLRTHKTSMDPRVAVSARKDVF